MRPEAAFVLGMAAWRRAPELSNSQWAWEVDWGWSMPQSSMAKHHFCFLVWLNVVLNFGAKNMTFLDHREPIRTHTNRTGQLLIDLMSFPTKACPSQRQSRQEVGAVNEEPSCSVPELSQPCDIPESPDIPQQHEHIPCHNAEVQSCQEAVSVPLPPLPHETPRRPKTTVTLNKKKECRCLLAQMEKPRQQESTIAVAATLCK